MPRVHDKADKLAEILCGELSGDVRVDLAKNRAKEILLVRGDIPAFPALVPARGADGPIQDLRAIRQLQDEFEQRLAR